MDNDMQSMLEVYLFEAKDLLEHLDGILLNCEKANGFDSESVNEIFRIMHTIKGSSAMMQFNSLTTVAHKVEDLFFFVRDKGLDPKYNSELTDIVFHASDFLSAEIARVENNEPLTEDIQAISNEIDAFLKRISSNESAAPAEKTEDAIPAETADAAQSEAAAAGRSGDYPFAVRVFLDEEAKMLNIRALMLVNSISEVCQEFHYQPHELENNDDSSEEIGRSGLLISFREKKELDLALKTIEGFLYTKSFTLEDMQTAPAREESASTATAVKETAVNNPSVQHTAKQSLINVKLSKLDQLMDLMGEIVITESMVTTLPQKDSGEIDINFSKASRQLRKLTDELQEIVMSIRMVPISGVFQRMGRIVRDMSKNLGKDVSLEMVGEDTEMDKAIVDSIGDPIMHLVRNSMDHGLETREEREAAGKPPKGTIRLSAQNSGGEILIAVEDDGKGIDETAVLAKAKSKGLLKKPEKDYSKREIFSFLMMPGFSTNEVVTEYSGRGVGMDVVKKNVEGMGGNVSITSELGKGTKILFKIPLTLAIIDGMKVSTGDCVFTIPIYSIRQLFKVEDDSVFEDTGKNEIIRVRDNYYPLVRLSKIFQIKPKSENIRDGIVVLVETHERAYCIFADTLIGEQQVVVKSLPNYLNHYGVKETGIAGCAILGDGSISLILDMTNLLNNVNL